MNESKHTSGNWDWIGESEPVIFSSQRKEETENVDIAMCFDITGDEQIANAQLIAAAPDLLIALKNLQEAVREHGLLDIKKRFSLCTADAQANKVIAQVETE